MYSCLQKAALAVRESTAESTVFLPAKGCARSSPRVCMRRTIHALRLRPRARRTRSLHRKEQPTLDSTLLPSSEKLGLLSSSSSESEIRVRANIYRRTNKKLLYACTRDVGRARHVFEHCASTSTCRHGFVYTKRSRAHCVRGVEEIASSKLCSSVEALCLGTSVST